MKCSPVENYSSYPVTKEFFSRHFVIHDGSLFANLTDKICNREVCRVVLVRLQIIHGLERAREHDIMGCFTSFHVQADLKFLDKRDENG